jgi:hypothetical protein
MALEKLDKESEEDLEFGGGGRYIVWKFTLGDSSPAKPALSTPDPCSE